jgi:hypothetical protein
MRNIKLLMPRNSDYRLVFPLMMYTFRYDRSSFSVKKVNEKCNDSEFHAVMDDIERVSEYFKRFLVVKLVSLFSIISLGLLLVIGIGIIAYDAIVNNNRTKEEFTNLTNNPKGHLMDNRSNDLSDVTVIGIFLIILGVFQFVIILIVVNCSTKKAIEEYAKRINEILVKKNNLFQERGFKWTLGDGCMWIELRLDFKYNLLALNSENIIRNHKAYSSSQQIVSQKEQGDTPPRSVRMFDFANERQILNESLDSGKDNSQGKRQKLKDGQGKKEGASHRKRSSDKTEPGHILLDLNKI